MQFIYPLSEKLMKASFYYNLSRLYFWTLKRGNNSLCINLKYELWNKKSLHNNLLLKSERKSIRGKETFQKFISENSSNIWLLQRSFILRGVRYLVNGTIII